MCRFVFHKSPDHERAKQNAAVHTSCDEYEGHSTTGLSSWNSQSPLDMPLTCCLHENIVHVVRKSLQLHDRPTKHMLNSTPYMRSGGPQHVLRGTEFIILCFSICRYYANNFLECLGHHRTIFSTQQTAAIKLLQSAVAIVTGTKERRTEFTLKPKISVQRASPIASPSLAAVLASGTGVLFAAVICYHRPSKYMCLGNYNTVLRCIRPTLDENYQGC